MNRHASEDELALYACGDLDQRASTRTASHLAECRVCVVHVAEFQSARDMLAAAAEQPSASDVLEVRQRVMSRIAVEQTGGHRWAWAFALSFGIFIAVLWMKAVSTLGPVINQPLNPLPLVAQIPAPELVVPAIRVPRRPPRDRAGIRNVTVIQDSKGNAMIKLQTADPNVVILLEGERTEAE